MIVEAIDKHVQFGRDLYKRCYYMVYDSKIILFVG